jgi:hypothetical protein
VTAPGGKGGHTVRQSSSFRAASRLAAAAVVAGLVGCVPPEPAGPPPPLRIEFVNGTALDLTPNFYYSDSAADAPSLFVVAHLNTSFIQRPFAEIPSRGTAHTVLACERVRSLGVSRPRVFNAAVLEVTDSGEEIFLLREADYDCGATLRFVYYLEGETLRVRLETD